MNKLIQFLKSERFAEIFRFAVNGGVSFVVDYAVLFILTEFFDVNYLISSGISFTLSVIVNYLICVLWVFKNVKKNDTKTVVLFVGSSVIGLLINQVLMWFFVEITGLYYMIAKIIATIIVMIWNYVAKRKAVVG
ncbi:MAG: GtrA family protein [Eubacterium sp.]|nr:GtrA family protein [Eubacterium sp.]